MASTVIPTKLIPEMKHFVLPRVDDKKRSLHPLIRSSRKAAVTRKAHYWLF